MEYTSNGIVYLDDINSGSVSRMGTIAICVFGMIAIALIVLGYKTFKVSSLNAVKTLRSE